MDTVQDIILELIAFALALVLAAGACSLNSFPTRPDCDDPAHAEAQRQPACRRKVGITPGSA